MLKNTFSNKYQKIRGTKIIISVRKYFFDLGNAVYPMVPGHELAGIVTFFALRNYIYVCDIKVERCL